MYPKLWPHIRAVFDQGFPQTKQAKKNCVFNLSRLSYIEPDFTSATTTTTPHLPLASSPHTTAIMGRVRTKTVKKSAKAIIERYYPRLTLDFETNKRVCDEIAIIASKRLRNKIAGYTTHLMKRIERGPVRGISFKLQEEERERKDQYVPEVSALDFAQNSESGQLDVDVETKDLLKHLGVSFCPPHFGSLCPVASQSHPLVLLLTMQFDAIPVNVVPVTQVQTTERNGRRFGDRPRRD